MKLKARHFWVMCLVAVLSCFLLLSSVFILAQPKALTPAPKAPRAPAVVQASVENGIIRAKLTTSDATDTVIVQFNDLLKMLYGSSVWYPGLKLDNKTIEIINQSGETYRVTGYSFTAGLETFYRTTNKPAQDAGYNAAAVDALTPAQWVQLNQNYIQANGIDPLDPSALGDIVNTGHQTNTQETDADMLQMAQLYFFGHGMFFSFDTTQQPLTDAGIAAGQYSVFDYLNNMSNPAVLSILSGDFASGTTKVFPNTGVWIHGDRVGNPYQGIAMMVNVNLTLTKVSVTPPQPVDVKVRKVNEGGTALSGASFTVRNASNAVVGPDTSASNGTGEVSYKLPAGNYTLTETRAPNGYTGLGSTVGFSVASNGAIQLTSGNGSGLVAVSGNVLVVTNRAQTTPTPPDPTPPGPDGPDTPLTPTPAVPGTPGGGAAAPVTPVVPTPDTPDTPDDASPAVPPASSSLEEPDVSSIPSESVPLTQPETPTSSPIWALLNLICAIWGICIAIVLVVHYIVKRKEERPGDSENEEEYAEEEPAEEEPARQYKKKRTWTLVGILFGVVLPVVFLLTENMSYPMRIVDRWTPLMLLLVILQLVPFLLAIYKGKPKEEEAQAEE